MHAIVMAKLDVERAYDQMSCKFPRKGYGCNEFSRRMCEIGDANSHRIFSFYVRKLFLHN